MECYGLNQGYAQLGMGVFYMHDAWCPPPPPAPILKYMPGMVVEGPAFMGWFGGLFVTHKHGLKTFFDGNRALQQGHDAGYLIPHLPLPPHLLMFVHMLVSKHKVMFPIISVDIEGKPMGTYFNHFLGLICSNPVSLPTGVLLKFSGTVVTHMTLKDFLLGLAFIVVDMAIDAIWSLIFKADKWSITPGKYKLLMGRGFTAQVFKTTPMKNVFNKIFTDNVANPTKGPAWQLFTRNLALKAVDHLGKSWAMSPLVAGTIFQFAIHPVSGLDRKQLPGVAVGRSQIGWSFFPWGKRGNLFN